MKPLAIALSGTGRELRREDSGDDLTSYINVRLF
jgi:hypothetical protein